MVKTLLSFGRVLALGLLIALPACAADNGSDSPTTGGPSTASEEPLDPMEGEDNQLELGKGDVAQRTLPAFDDLWANYPHGTAAEVKELIGGNVNADWIVNTCTIRISRTLNYSGFEIPRTIKGLNTVRGGDDLRYAYRVAELRRYFNTVLGPPDIVGKTPADFEGKKGVIVFEVTGWSDASGHFDLWDGYQPAHAEYFDKASKVQLWLAK